MIVANVKIFTPNMTREKYFVVTYSLNDALPFMVACAMTFRPIYDSIFSFCYRKLSFSGGSGSDKAAVELAQVPTIGGGQALRRKAIEDAKFDYLTDTVSEETHLASHHSHR